MLASFAALVLAEGLGPVADIGCGPGRITGHLHRLGLDVFGLDLSPSMVAVARQVHPGLRFVEGSMTALDLPDSELGGISLTGTAVGGLPVRRAGVSHGQPTTAHQARC